MTRNKVIGYTAGVFDLFHIGHLNILRNAKSMCDFLIVGVTTDEAVKKYKKKKPVIPYHERVEIVRNIKFVDSAIPQNDRDKFMTWEKLKYNILFVGDDWFGHEKWVKYEKKLQMNQVDVVYLPYTSGTSSTFIKDKIQGNKKTRNKVKQNGKQK